MNCSKCNCEVNESQKFCPQCGTKICKEQTCCPMCNNPVKLGDKFCKTCGARLSESNSVSTPALAVNEYSPKKKNTGQKVIIMVVVLLFVLIIASVVISQNTIENRLMRNTWWDTEMEVYSWDHPRQPFCEVSVYYDCHTFCESGNHREESFKMKFTIYDPQEPPEDESDLSRSVEFDEVESKNGYKWELLENKELFVFSNYYKWSAEKSDDTWYLKGSELRIGDQYYTSKRKKFSVDKHYSSNDIPYWCEYCGEAGPFGDECPECEHKKKVKCDW